MPKEEFQEIYLSGGKFELKKCPDGRVSVEYHSLNPWPMAMFQVCVSLDGKVLDMVPFGGIGQVVPYPQPSLVACVLSDRHGMFGRRCPECHSYFRTDACFRQRFCPYCGYSGQSIQFLTENQLSYISAFCNSVLDTQRGDHAVILDLDQLVADLPQNRPQWVYSEEQQQNSYTCGGCRAKYDILGEYGLCPQCGKPNLADVFQAKMEEFDRHFSDADKALSDRHERETEWEKLTRCVSEFESMGNQLRAYMQRFPATLHRRNAVKALTFQNVLKVNDCLREWYGFEILEGVSEADRRFLNVMFNRRHVFTHKAGRVDQEYLDNTGDTTVRLNQVLRVRSKEMRRLIPLVRECGLRLIRGYESIQ